jgi:sugar/nucleoside kinase (ribokinase family)
MDNAMFVKGSPRRSYGEAGGKIICVGSACKDIFFPTSEGKISATPEDLLSQKKISFELGAKYKIEERFESLGGCAVNVACALAQLGIAPDCYSKLGDDHNGRWIRSKLEEYGVKQELITTEKYFASDLSAIIVDETSGERIIFSNQKVNGTLQIDPENLKKAKWIFIGDLQGAWEEHLQNIFQIAKKNKIRIVFNPRQNNIHDNVQKIREYLPYAEIVFLNKDEALEIVSTQGNFSKEKLTDEKFLITELKKIGGRIVVMTDGSMGAWAMQEEKIFFVPAIKVKAYDSTGAGDAFSGAFWGAYLKGEKIAECLKWGIVNGGSVVQFYGGQRGLLSEADLRKDAKNLEVKEI